MAILRMKIFKFLTVLFFLTMFYGCSNNSSENTTISAQKNQAENITYVNAKSGLRIRRTASLRGEKLALIPHGTPVEIIKTTDKEMTIDGETGKWVEIRYKNLSGWVFDAFLSENLNQNIK